MSVRSAGRGVPGAVGPVGPVGPTGAQGPQGPTGPTGPSGIVPVYNSSGLVSGIKMWIGSVTTTSGGNFTVNFSSAGFLSAPLVHLQPISSNNTPSDAIIASMTASSTTTCSGSTYLSNTITLLGIIPLRFAGSGIVIKVIAIGT